jgi:tyrosine-protein kinase Etk/Wzc
MDNNRNNPTGDFMDEKDFDYKELLGKILDNWYLFIIGVTICLLGSYFYAKYATTSYKINSKLLVEDQKNSPSSGSGVAMMSDFSSLFDLPSNALNEIDIIKSRTMMAQVVDQLNLNVVLYHNEGWKLVELYDKAPFNVKINYKTDSITNTIYDLKIAPNGIIHLINSKDDIDITSKFGETVKLGQYDLIFEKKNTLANISGSYKLGVQSKDSRTEGLMKALDAQLSDKQSTTINLTLTYPVSGKGEVILQQLMIDYIQANLENKVRTADSTIAFVDRRLVGVSLELNNIEKQFESFKSENNLANVEEQSKALVGASSDYFNQLNVQEIQLTVINDLEKYIKDPSNKTIIPSSLTDQDPVFADAIGKYNELLLERDKLDLSYKDDNPVVKSLDDQISNVKSNLLKSFAAYKRGLQISKNELNTRNQFFTKKIKEVPEKERVFLDYSRQQTLKQELYLYLLQKREETAISKTSTISSIRIIDSAKSDNEPFKPKHSLIYLIGLAIGIIIPLSYVSIRSSLNIKIVSKSDIEKHTQIPIVAEIGNSTENNSLVVIENSRSVISEQFRSLRTNLQYLIKSKDTQVIMLTSSMSGEGKTFVTINLGGALALSGKKVVFIELDLRKPKLALSLGVDNPFGFTNYVVSEKDDIEQLIKPVPSTENLYLISSGPIPPNPSEILLSEKLGNLIAQLKFEKRFDFIIIDSAPVGLVADGLIIESFVDVNLYVIRQNYTLISSLKNINQLVDTQKLKHTYLVINDIKVSRSGYYGYGYGQNYGYGYGNYGQETKKTFLEKVKEKF